MQNNSNSCALVIASCDSFSDLWEPFFTFLFRYWSDYPYPIYLISDTKTYSDSRVTTLTQGVQGKDWSSCVIDSLGRIPEKYILYVQEDYLLTGTVNTSRIQELLDLLIAKDVACIRLYPSPAPDKPYSGDLGEITKGPQYSFSLQAALWNKAIFSSLLERQESIRVVEEKASLRAQRITEPFLSVFKSDRPLPYFATAVKGGTWYYDAAKLCRKAGLTLDPKRKVEALSRYVMRKMGIARLVGIWRYSHTIIRDRYLR